MGLKKKARDTDAMIHGAADQYSFDRSHVYYILSNLIFAGRIRHRNQTMKASILQLSIRLSRKLFDETYASDADASMMRREATGSQEIGGKAVV